MDVEQPASIALDESRREDAHETSERDETGRKPIDFAGKDRFERLASGEGAVLDDVGKGGTFARKLVGDFQSGGGRSMRGSRSLKEARANQVYAEPAHILL